MGDPASGSEIRLIYFFNKDLSIFNLNSELSFSVTTVSAETLIIAAIRSLILSLLNSSNSFGMGSSFGNCFCKLLSVLNTFETTDSRKVLSVGS